MKKNDMISPQIQCTVNSPKSDKNRKSQFYYKFNAIIG